MSVLKDHYYRLASDLPKERLQAATDLLSELTSVDSTQDWDYALNRLVKGLITTRQSARFGFSMALTEVISELLKKTLTIPDYLTLLSTTTTLKSSMKGKEERSVLFGKLFGLQALINSKVLFNPSLSSFEIISSFISTLLELAASKSWLRESATFTLCQFIKIISDSPLPFKDDILLQILQSTNDNDLNLSTEGIAIYLSIPNSATLSTSVTNPKSFWKNGNPLSRGNLPTLAKALKDVEVIEDTSADEVKNDDGKKKKSTQKGSWNPKLPFVWELLVNFFNTNGKEQSDDDEETTSHPSKKRSKNSSKVDKKQKSDPLKSEIVSLKEFWLVVIDQSLFSEKSSHERKYWGFEIFQLFLQNLNKSDQIEYLFTPNLLRCLINQSGQSGRYLNQIANQTLTIIQQVGKKDFLKSQYIISRLIDSEHGGCWNFDLLTKSKTIDSLLFLNTSDDSSSKEVKSTLVSIAKLLVNNFDHYASQPTVNETILRWNLDKLLLLIRSNKKVSENLKKGDKFFETILNLLLKNSFIANDKLSANINKFSQDKLNSVLSEIINSKRQDGTSWSLYCVKFVSELDTETLRSDLDEEIKAVQIETTELLDDIVETTPKTEQLYSFELMFSMILLQLYQEDEEAVQVLEELKDCYEQLTKKDDDFDTSVVLTEIILSLASRKSTLTKKLVNIIWNNLCVPGELTLNEASLQLLFDVLITRENKEGQKKLFEGEEEYEEENENGEDDEDEDNKEDDDKEVDEKEDDEEKIDDEDDDDSDSDSSISDDDEDEAEDGTVSQIDQETNLKLAQALNLPSGEVNFSSDSEYESDSMDDEQMMAMDEQLSTIFKERRNALDKIVTGNKRKAEVEDAREQMIFFKHRILDLLDIYFKHQTESVLCLKSIEPLLTLIHLTLDKNIGTKAHKLLKTKISKVRITSESKDEAESILEMIKRIQSNASGIKSNQGYVLACNQACIILTKNLISLDESHLEKVIDVYTESLKSWAFNPKSKLQASLFFDFINWLNSKR